LRLTRRDICAKISLCKCNLFPVGMVLLSEDRYSERTDYMKRFISIFSAAAVLLSLTACRICEVGSAADSAADIAVTSEGAGDSSPAAQPEATVTVVTSPAHFDATVSVPPEEIKQEDNVMADGADAAVVPTVTYVPLTAQDISLSIPESGSITTDTERVTLEFTYVGAAENAEYCFGSSYTLKKLVDGEWNVVPFAENAAFNALGYLIGSSCPKNSISVSLSDDFYAQAITAGTYCVETSIDGVVMEQSFIITDAQSEDADISDTAGDMGENAVQRVPLGANDVIAQLDSAEYATGTDSVKLQLTYVGSSDAQYIVGCDYKLEKWDNSIGDWRDVPFAENTAFTEEGYEISAASDCTITLGIGAHMFDEELTAGTYRITKPLCDGVDSLLVFELKDVDAESGMVIEQASGEMSFIIDEILADRLICSLTFPSPLVYEVLCDPVMYQGFSVGDCIRAGYEPLYRVDEMNYKFTATFIEASENNYMGGVTGIPEAYSES